MNMRSLIHAFHRLLILLTLCALITGNLLYAGDALSYENYYAARRALAKGDCSAVINHLTAYLQNHPVIKTQYPDHFFEVKLAIQQCSGNVKISGIGDESDRFAAPLPEHPPMKDL